MDFGDVMRLFDYWAEHPPLHLMVANFLGYKTTQKRKATNADMQQLLRDVNPAGKSSAIPVDRAPLYIQQMIAEAKQRG